MELDVYYDEMFKFKSSVRNLPYMFKDPDEITDAQFQYMQGYVNNMEEALYDDERFAAREYVDYLDVDSFIDWWFVHELTGNIEPLHPKSTYMYKDRLGKMHAGPVWDFDWAGATSSTSFVIKNTIYYDRLFKDEDFCAKVEELLDSENLTQSKIENKIEEMREQISSSVALDRLVWSKHNNPVGSQFDTLDEYVNDLKECVVARLTYFENVDF